MLDLARLEAEEHALSLSPLDLTQAVTEAVRLLTPLASRKGLHLATQFPATPMWALADSAALGRVLYNLIGNALKFTEHGGVQIRVLADAEHVAVEVTDTGIGIGPDFVPQLFEEFKQESTGLARNHEGCGLGLTITKRLVELMGGTVSVTSTPGEGSSFTVRLPALPPAEAPFCGDGAMAAPPLFC